jgi:hypothetical protein
MPTNDVLVDVTDYRSKVANPSQVDDKATTRPAVVGERIGDLAFVERTFSSLEVAWSAQCLCKSNKSSLYRKLVKSAKAEE